MPIETERGLKVTVSFAQRRVLYGLAQRGRRLVYNKVGLTKEANDGLQGLADMLLVTLTPLVGTDRVEMKLTDLGAQVVDQLDKGEKVSAQADPNYQAMLGNGEATCMTCNTSQKVQRGKFVPHVIQEIKDGTLHIGRCPGSERNA